MYLIKIGNHYLTSEGTVSPFQRDALRVSDDVRIASAGPDWGPLPVARIVHLKPRQSSQTTYNAPDIDPRD